MANALHLLPAVILTLSMPISACSDPSTAKADGTQQSLAATSSSTRAGPAPDASHPIVVELYQSQGCSSCPPAQAALNRIADTPGVLALSFAVTYWDRLGWKDVFGQQAFTDRQRAYAKAEGSFRVYTPQVIINGERRLVGNRPGELAQAVSAAHRVDTAITVASSKGTVTVSGAKGQSDRSHAVWLVHYNPRIVNVAIGTGENSGRTLPHRNIVTGLTRLGTYRGGAQNFVVHSGPPSGQRSAILIQDGAAGPIVAAQVL